jgi:type IV pilus assembly protein PilV
MQGTVCPDRSRGFSLVEVMIALSILVFGLLAAGQMLFIASASGSLARSKGTAAIAAQDRLETLADLYRIDPSSMDLTAGDHGPVRTEITNPNDRTTLNLFEITWNISGVSDPRPKTLKDVKLIRVTVTPIQHNGEINSRPNLNKILNVMTVFSPTL